MNSADIIETAIEIAEEYRDEHDLTLTLRQLYYQFVARGLLPNGDKVYKRLGQVLTSARLSGKFPISYLEDRGRSVGESDAKEALTVSSAIQHIGNDLATMPGWITHGRWYRQPTKVSVWVEKDALAGVLEPVCEELGVGLFPCRGYPSISSLAAWVKDTYESIEDVDREESVILYLGDHDPDGLQIPISAEDTLHRIMDVELGTELGAQFQFNMDRIALTLDQIKEYNPPPMPAKPTSSRYAAYRKETGLTLAWELDALDPPTLQNLVRDGVDALFDHAIYEENVQDQGAKRVRLIERVCSDPEWINRMLRSAI